MKGCHLINLTLYCPTVLASHIAGTDNSIADSLSLRFADHLVSSTSPRGRYGSYFSPQILRDPLADRLAFLQSQAIADSTRHSYLAGVRRYTPFCSSKQWQSFPTTEATLHYFATHLADQVFFKTIKLNMVGICHSHVEKSLPDPFQDAPLLHLLLCGSKSRLSSQCHLPITMTLLHQLKDKLQ